jgi:hypothetical protein
MAKRTAHLHLGLPHSGGERLDAALHDHAAALAEAGVLVPSRSVDETFRAAVELRRDHKAWGLRRKDVEGVWAGICRRADKGSGDVVVGHHLMAGATDPEIDLLVHGLAGFSLHLVVTVAAPDARLTAFPDDHDLAAVLGRWERVVTSPDRVHVVVCDVADPVPAWTALGDLVGFPAAGLEVPAPRVGEVDTHALRLLAEGTSSLATHEDLEQVVAAWVALVAERGYDVRGDLGTLAQRTREAGEGDDSAAATSALGEALSDSLAEITRLRARARELERDNARLTSKKRKLKQRLSDAIAG